MIVNFEKTDHYGVVEVYLIVTKEIKDYTKDMGPVNAIKLVINNKMIYHFYIYLEIFEEGSLTQPHDICTLPLIQKMNDSNFFIYKDISNYSTYRKSIGFDCKSVVHCVVPSDTVRYY